MRNYSSPIVLVISLWWLVGCTSQPLLTQLPANKRIGLVSLLGDELVYQHLRTTIFTSYVGLQGTPKLDMNAEAVSALERRLRKNGRYVAVSLQDAAPRLIKPYEGRRGMKYAFDVEKSKKDLEWLKSHSDIDFLLVLTPDQYSNEYRRPQFYIGYGYYCSSFLGPGEAGVYLAAILTLVDMATLKTAGWYSHFSVRKVDHRCADRIYAEFEEEDRDYVDRALEDLIAETLPNSLVGMNIVPGDALSKKTVELPNNRAHRMR